MIEAEAVLESQQIARQKNADLNNPQLSNIKDSLVLIVDDTPKNIQLLGTVLKQHGFRVAIAINGKQTLEFIKRRKPDLILLDVMMPEMDGFAVCKAIKKDPDSASIPVIFLTARTEREDKLKGFSVGGADYIAKPFQSEEVIARVNTHLRLKRSTELLQQNAENLENMLQERTHQLIRSERHAAFSLLMEGIIHNLKNPLSSISGGAELIEAATTDLQEKTGRSDSSLCREAQKNLDNITHYSGLIEAGATRLMEMINSMMAKSRTDKLEDLVRVDLNELIEQEISFLEADLRFRTCKKELLLSKTPLMVEIVPSEITQVLQNLVGNALDAMSKQKKRQIQISSGRSGTYTWLSVCDNGPGIPAKIRERIFDPFFSTKPKAGSATTEPAGTGLGLYTCIETAKSYGGSIVLERERGREPALSSGSPTANSVSIKASGSSEPGNRPYRQPAHRFHQSEMPAPHFSDDVPV